MEKNRIRRDIDRIFVLMQVFTFVKNYGMEGNRVCPVVKNILLVWTL